MQFATAMAMTLRVVDFAVSLVARETIVDETKIEISGVEDPEAAELSSGLM